MAKDHPIMQHRCQKQSGGCPRAGITAKGWPRAITFLAESTRLPSGAALWWVSSHQWFRLQLGAYQP